MRLLIDSCVPSTVAESPRAAGHDVVSVAERPIDPGDLEILAWAAREQRVIVTLDKDFGTHAVLSGLPTVGIVRLVQLSVARLAVELLEVLTTLENELINGALVTAEPGRRRVRRVPTTKLH
jgi:predicted nuclease of predicted toxin-antitoxin system